MIDTLILSQKLLAQKIRLPESIRCTEIFRSADVSVISAEVISRDCNQYQATLVWRLNSDEKEPLHLHISPKVIDLPAVNELSLRAIDGKRYLLSADEIAFAHSSGRYMTVTTARGEQIVSAMTFSSLNEVTGGILLRIHRSYSVNPQFVAEISSSAVTLKNSLSLPLSRSYAPAVKDVIRALRYEKTHILTHQSI